MCKDVLVTRFEVVPPEDGKWGVMDNNGLYNGMIGQLVRNEVSWFHFW